MWLFLTLLYCKDNVAHDQGVPGDNAYGGLVTVDVD